MPSEVPSDVSPEAHSLLVVSKKAYSIIGKRWNESNERREKIALVLSTVVTDDSTLRAVSRFVAVWG